jgi:hypothetical protein
MAKLTPEYESAARQRIAELKDAVGKAAASARKLPAGSAQRKEMMTLGRELRQKLKDAESHMAAK